MVTSPRSPLSWTSFTPHLAAMPPTNAPLAVSWLALLFFALVPLLLIATTSFVKLSVVFSLLRNALGTPDVPSGLVVTALATVLSLFVMSPVLSAAADATREQWAAIDINDPLRGKSLEAVSLAVSAGREPLRMFLKRNAGANELTLFVDLAKRTGSATQEDFAVIAPAFLLTELKEALQIGFLLFLPFLVLDVVITSLLVALGMQALSPTNVAMPFKLLLFVLVDGFVLLSRALVAGYQ
jgi:type III secretion protein R